MGEYKAFAPGVEVNGRTVLAIVDAMKMFESTALSILDECGISDPQPDLYYSQQAWLNAFKKISEQVGASTLFIIGKRIPENAKFPPDIDSIEKALQSINLAYHMNHRGGDIGYYRYEKTGDSSARMVCKNPYPCDFDRGIIETMAKKFRPEGNIVRIEHDKSAGCRKKNGDTCIYNVFW